MRTHGAECVCQGTLNCQWMLYWDIFCWVIQTYGRQTDAQKPMAAHAWFRKLIDIRLQLSYLLRPVSNIPVHKLILTENLINNVV